MITTYLRTTLIAVFLLSSVITTSAASEEPASPVSLDSSVSFFSQYMFRGQPLYSGASIEPSLTANYDTGYGTVSANLWMHISGDSSRQSERFTELDETIKYQNVYGPVTFSVGNAWYTYSDYGDGTDIEDSAEVFGSALLDAPLSPILTVYHDWRALDSNYYELGFSHEISGLDANESTLVPFVAFGFASNSEKIYARDGLEQITTGAALNMTLADVSVVPNVNYSFKVDDNTVNQFWFGMTFGYSL